MIAFSLSSGVTPSPSKLDPTLDPTSLTRSSRPSGLDIRLLLLPPLEFG